MAGPRCAHGSRRSSSRRTRHLWLQAPLHTVAGVIICGHRLHYIRLQAQLEPTHDGAFKADDPLYLLLALAKKFRFVNAHSLSLEATYTNGTQQLR